eukprot:145883-Amphidinium_carterae.1
MFKTLKAVWDTSEPEILGYEGCETLRFLGYDLEYSSSGSLLVHQHTYIVELLEKFSPSLVIKTRANPGEAETF